MGCWYDKDFFYKKVQILETDKIRYLWYLIKRGEKQGVHFHGYWYANPDAFVASENTFGFSAHGIEAHCKEPIYEGQTPVSNCEITCGDCYTSGSSLLANERLGYINPKDDLFDTHVWTVLHEYYEKWIKEVISTPAYEEKQNGYN